MRSSKFSKMGYYLVLVFIPLTLFLGIIYFQLFENECNTFTNTCTGGEKILPVSSNSFVTFDPLILIVLLMPVLMALFMYDYKSCPNYSVNLDVSHLGSKHAPKNKLHNLLMVFFGAIIILLGIRLGFYAGYKHLAMILPYIIILTGVFCALVGIIHKDMNLRLHDWVASIAFFFLALSNVFGMFFSIMFFPSPVDILFAAFSIFNFVMLFILGWRFVIQKKLDKYTFRMEWMVFISSLLYIYFASLIIYFHL